MANKNLSILLCLFLAACGSGESNSNTTWNGGIWSVWSPATPNGKAIILHQGHSPFNYADHDLTGVAQQFSDAGFVVYGMEMPFPSPHDSGPLSKFTDPVTKLVDELTKQGLKTYMVGLSGGGWTTTVVTYLDPRIIKGYSVAGDHPTESYMGDWESKNPPAPYKDMYAATSGRLVHIYNWDDPCCFARIQGDIGGEYVTDYTTQRHEISAWAVSYIISDIR